MHGFDVFSVSQISPSLQAGCDNRTGRKEIVPGQKLFIILQTVPWRKRKQKLSSVAHAYA
jgi:hypothetical protein